MVRRIRRLRDWQADTLPNSYAQAQIRAYDTVLALLESLT